MRDSVCLSTPECTWVAHIPEVGAIRGDTCTGSIDIRHPAQDPRQQTSTTHCRIASAWHLLLGLLIFCEWCKYTHCVCVYIERLVFANQMTLLVVPLIIFSWNKLSPTPMCWLRARPAMPLILYILANNLTLPLSERCMECRAQCRTDNMPLINCNWWWKQKQLHHRIPLHYFQASQIGADLWVVVYRLAHTN